MPIAGMIINFQRFYEKPFQRIYPLYHQKPLPVNLFISAYIAWTIRHQKILLTIITDKENQPVIFGLEKFHVHYAEALEK